MTTLDAVTPKERSEDRMGGVSVRDGLATLGGNALALRSALDAQFAAWASAGDAVAMAFPPLVPIADLALLDYFDNFPHLALLASGLNDEALGQSRATGRDHVEASDLADAGYALPSAACYSAYLHLRGTVVGEARYVTMLASCFRREKYFDSLRRLLGFSMREIVCIGSRDAVIDHLSTFKLRICAFADELGLPLNVQAACDPFFEPTSSRALLQQMFPVKEEFVFGEDLAIASVNFHRNFFGERCDIRLEDGNYAFTGCVAFGLERWMQALSTQFGEDDAALVDRLPPVHGHSAGAE